MGRANEQAAAAGNLLAGAAERPLAADLFERHPLAMLLIDPASGRILDANPAAAAFYGHTREALAVMHIGDINTLSSHDIRAEMARARRLQSNHFLFRHRVADGSEWPVEVYSVPVRIDGREVLHSIVRTVEEPDAPSAERRERLERDALTGLANRAVFRACIERAVAGEAGSGTRVAVLHIDLDRFRDINELWGHEAGDSILRQAAEAVRGCVGEGHTVARLGGDELGMVVSGVDAPSVGGPGGIAERVRATFHRTAFRLGDQSVNLYASVGLTLYPDHALQPEALMRHAEAAVQKAKRDGGDRCAFYASDLAGSASERIILGSDLRRAIDQGGLRLALQPVVALADGRAVGCEALARWPHPDQGWIGPDRFVPVAEITGLITDLGEWVLNQAARHCMRRGAGAPRQLAVNVSSLQLRTRDIVRTVRDVLARTGLAPGRLELEITESAFVDETGELDERLRSLRALGVAIAIDDFGTGYSSLQYLKRLPVDRIKIDRAFVRDVDTDADNRAIVATIVALAHQFGLGLTAEGVETAGEARALLDLGCHYAQGYYYAAPELIDTD